MKMFNFDVASSDIDDFDEWGSWRVNGKKAEKNVADYLTRGPFLNLSQSSEVVCPYCGESLKVTMFDDEFDGNETWHFDRYYAFKHCRRCAHWEFGGSEGGNKCMDSKTSILASSVTAKFSENFPSACSDELAQFLRRKPELWHNLNPKRCEKLVADVFKANHQESEVIHVGKPFDEGVDVIFIESGGTKWLVQVKRREKPHKAEGFSTLQNILGTLALKGERHGIIVSTADSFSYHARRAQKKAMQQGFVVKMVDKGVLDRMIGALLPRPPWKEIFSHPDIKHLEKDIQHHFWGPECDGQMTLFGD